MTVLDQNHRISAALTKAFVANDLLRLEVMVENTGFYVKGDAQPTLTDIGLLALPLYRELVFAEIPAPPRFSGVRKFVRDRVPGAAPLYRRLKTLVPVRRC